MLSAGNTRKILGGITEKDYEVGSGWADLLLLLLLFVFLLKEKDALNDFWSNLGRLLGVG